MEEPKKFIEVLHKVLLAWKTSKEGDYIGDKYLEFVEPIIQSFGDESGLTNDRFDFTEIDGKVKLEQAIAFLTGVAVGADMFEGCIETQKFTGLVDEEFSHKDLCQFIVGPAFGILVSELEALSNIYYVYEAIVDGETKYIGKGSGDRINHVKSGRSSCRQLNADYTKGRSIEVEKIKENLAEQDALTLERQLIKDYFDKGFRLYNRKPK